MVLHSYPIDLRGNQNAYTGPVYSDTESIKIIGE